MSDELDHEFVEHRRFAIRRRIGAGGMGVVYHAYDRDRGHDVALKTLKVFAGAHLYRLKREFRALADVTHPNLVALYELFSERDVWFLTMELIRGSNFLEYVWRTRPGTQRTSMPAPSLMSASPLAGASITRSIVPRAVIDDEATTAHAKETPLPGGSLEALLRDEMSTEAMHRSVVARADTDRLMEALRQLAVGVSALHSSGKLHRDIKPSNVLVTPAGRVVLLDFGLVTDLGPDALKSLTRDQIAGTLAYMAPEQSSGKPATPAADWYSVGVVLYEALTGRLPFEGNGMEMLINRLSKRPPPPSSLTPDVPEDLDRLASDLLAPAPEERPAGREILSRLGASARAVSTFVVPGPEIEPTKSLEGASSAFVGRNRHLATLEDAYAGSREGSSIFVHVRGAAGIGKTSLVRKFLAELRSRESTVVISGRCHERESLPLKAVDVLVDSLSQYLSRLSRREAGLLLPRGTSALSRLFPVLERVEAAAALGEEEAQTPRDRSELERRAFAALREIIRRIGERAPLVLFVDDLQWSDLESLQALATVLAPPDAPSVLFVACSRSEDDKKGPLLIALSKLSLGAESRSIQVLGLSFEESKDLAITLLGSSEGAFDKADQIAREARGSPFFVETMVRHTLKTLNASTDRIKLESVLRSRLGKLSPEARKLLEVVCVAGKAVPDKVAMAAAGLSPESEQPVIAALKNGSFIRTHRSEGRGTIEAFHVRVTEAVLAETSANTVTEHNLSLAGALEAHPGADPEMIGQLFAAAGSPGAASRWAVKAGDEASKLLNFTRAAQLYRSALGHGDRESQVDVREKLALALVGSGRGAEAGRVFLEVAEERDGFAAERASRQAGQHLLLSGHVKDGLELLQSQLNRQGQKLRDSQRSAYASRWIRSAQLWQAGLDFRPVREEDAPPEELERVDTLAAAAGGLFLIDFAKGIDLSGRHLLAALKLGEPERVLRAVAIETCYSSAVGLKPERRKELEDTARNTAKALDTPYARALVALTEGVAAHLSNEGALAMLRFEEAENLLKDQCAGAAFELATVRTFYHGALFLGGRLQTLARRVAELTDDADTRDDLLSATELRIGHPNAIWLVNDNPERAQRVVDEAMVKFTAPGFTTQKYFALFARVNAHIYAGQGAEAYALVKRGWPELRASQLMRTRPVFVSALHLRARAALAAAMSTGDESLLTAAEADAREIGRESIPWADPLVTLIRASVASISGDRSKAGSLLDLSLPSLAETGHVLMARAAKLWVGKLGLGAPGRDLANAAEHELRDEGVRNPEAFAGMLIPIKPG
ncbi:MAG: protein kinase [Deltaproteobacteria bacterium]|nr:protein kinase [Deltaproteobacteria bacterium]